METAPQRITSRAFTEQARTVFKNSGLTYSDIKVYHIPLLEAILTEELKGHENIKMTLSRQLKKDFKFSADGSIVHGYLKVDAYYFSKREAISFNNGGFIGFAGWADSCNVQPFVTGFIKWVGAISPTPEV